MKVLMIASVYPRYPEDKEVPWFREAVHRLTTSGIEVEILAPSYEKLPSHEIDGTTVHRFRYAPKSWENLTHDEGAPNKIRKNRLLSLLAIP